MRSELQLCIRGFLSASFVLLVVIASLRRPFGLLVDMIGPPSKHQKMDQMIMMMTVVALISLFLTAAVFNKHCCRTKLFCFGIGVDASIR